ncbi:unnamed protein product [Paramecium pentaurelia]|uniref:Uncharacterized protein n=1 Tax=Paramecium pentaurelia TaxID=43138 RepID=A0A8S1V411_9CILI|nr:unnamed protein product [Paramecium pentaurelia]
MSCNQKLINFGIHKLFSNHLLRNSNQMSKKSHQKPLIIYLKKVDQFLDKLDKEIKDIFLTIYNN